MSNPQSKIDSLKELNSKLVAEIAELRKENAKLKQIIEENTMRGARVEELEQKNTRLEARLAILEQGEKDASISPEQNHVSGKDEEPDEIEPTKSQCIEQGLTCEVVESLSHQFPLRLQSINHLKLQHKA
ncbi:3253_t:CDS:2 [Ambispora gerdemannii]|uniref:3253_t:CDS:1 n=1 Tax=Ambispora gerdemannii TaxID=144530 RepID=A0A9N9C993_9GLOM|nr:3253_t:CDS:2 [Ambispora gerdemannii]